MESFEGIEYYYHEGVPTVVDGKFDIYINESLYTTLYTTKNLLKEAAIGLLISDGIISNLSDINNIDISDNKIGILLKKKIKLERVYYDECVSISEIDTKLEHKGQLIKWDKIMNIFRDFNKTTASVKIGLAIHSSGIYEADSDTKIIVHDTSRHVSILKLIGLAITEKINFQKSIIMTTGRVSSDMIYRMAKLGIPLVLSLHGPLSSGLTASLISGITLICKIRKGLGVKGLTVLSHPERIIF